MIKWYMFSWKCKVHRDEVLGFKTVWKLYDTIG